MACKIWPRNRFAQSIYKHPHCTQISALQVSGFGIISDLITFQAKNCCFFMFFFCLNSRSRNVGSPKLAHMTLSIIVVMSPNFNYVGLTVCWLYANLSSSVKIREQNQWYYALARSPNERMYRPREF